MKNLAIIGSRTFNETVLFKAVMRGYSPEAVVSGGAAGADALAKQYAQEHGIHLQEILPEYKKYGSKAPIIRNKSIIDATDGVLAFWDQMSSGTQQAIKYAQEKGKTIHIAYISRMPKNRSERIGEPINKEEAQKCYLKLRGDAKIIIDGKKTKPSTWLREAKKFAQTISIERERLNYARDKVKHLVETSKIPLKNFTSLEEQDNIYLVVPSSTGNMFPKALAKILQNRFGGQIEDNWAVQDHTSKIKKLSMADKVFEERSYTLKNEFLASKAWNGKNIVLVEDVIDTGRTMDALREKLNNAGIRVDSVCSMVNTFSGLIGGKRFDSVAQTLLTKLIDAETMTEAERDGYEQKLDTLFHNAPDTVFAKLIQAPNKDCGKIKERIDAEYSRRVVDDLMRQPSERIHEKYGVTLADSVATKLRTAKAETIEAVEKTIEKHQQEYYWKAGEKSVGIHSIYMEKDRPAVSVKYKESRFAVYEHKGDKEVFWGSGKFIDKVKDCVERCAISIDASLILGKNLKKDIVSSSGLDKDKKDEGSNQLGLEL